MCEREGNKEKVQLNKFRYYSGKKIDISCLGFGVFFNVCYFHYRFDVAFKYLELINLILN